eukprot:gene8070-16561_t
MDGTTEGIVPVKSLEDVFDELPVKMFHYRLLFMAGLGFMADAMEVSLLSFLSICAAKEWSLSNTEMASITSVVFAGQLIGALFWGPLADQYGRRKSYIAASVFISVSGFLTGIAPNLPCLLVLRFLVGFGVGGLAVPFDLLAEFLPISHRGKFLLYIELFWTIGSLLVAGIAWAILGSYGWRLLAMLTAIPVTLACIISICYLPESARWHMEKGRVKEAEDICHMVAKINNTPLRPFSLSPKTPISESSSSSSSTHDTPSNDEHTSPASLSTSTFGGEYLMLLSPSIRWISLPLWFTWFAFGFTYYGVILFVARLFSTETSTDAECDFDYQPIFISSVSEVIGVAMTAVSIDTCGRSRTQAMFYAAAGVMVAVMGVSMPKTPLIIVSSLGRLFIFSASSATWVATPELFPTRMRATGHSMSNAMARLGAVFTPFLVQSKVTVGVVGGVLCLVNLVAAFLALSLPETKGKALDEVSYLFKDVDNVSIDDDECSGLLTGTRYS